MSQASSANYNILDTAKTEGRAEAKAEAWRPAKPTRPRKMQMVLLGEEAAAAGHHATAVTHFSKAIERNPVDLDAHIGRGLSAVALGDHERAVYDFSLALQLQPSVGHYLARGASLAAMRQYSNVPGALRDYALAIELAGVQRRDDLLVAGLMTRARLLEKLNRFEDAMEDLSRVLSVFNHFDVDEMSQGTIPESIFFPDEEKSPLRTGNNHSPTRLGVSTGELDSRASAMFSPTTRTKKYALRAEAHARRGYCLRKLGRLDESIKELRKAVGLVPREARHRHSLAESLLAHGDTEAANDHIRNALEFARHREPDLMRLHARVLLQLGDSEAAIGLLQESVKREPKRPVAHQMLADGLLKSGHIELALQSYAEVVRLGKVSLADIATRREQEARCERDPQLDTRSPLAIAAARAEIDALQVEATAVVAQAAHDMGMLQKGLGRLNEARESYEESLKHAPDRDETRMQLALTLVTQGWRLQALAEVEICLKRNGDWAEPRRLRAQLMVERGLLHEAEAEYSALLSCAGSDALDVFARGKVKCELHQPAEALADYEHALASWPGGVAAVSAQLWLYRASALRSLQRRQEALIDLEEALRRAVAVVNQKEGSEAEAVREFMADIFSLRGQCLHEIHSLEAAHEAYTQALEIREGDGVLLLLRSAVSYQLHKWDDAVAGVRAVLEPGVLEAEDVVRSEAYQLLGLALARCGEYWAGVAALSDALQVTVPNPHVLLQRATLLLMLGRATAALEDLNEAIELRPGWPRALHRRAFVYKELHEFHLAAADFEAAAKLESSTEVNYKKVYRERLPELAYDDDPEWQPVTSLLEYTQRLSEYKWDFSNTTLHENGKQVGSVNQDDSDNSHSDVESNASNKSTASSKTSGSRKSSTSSTTSSS